MLGMSMQQPFSPIIGAASGAAQSPSLGSANNGGGAQMGRTVYVGNLPADAAVDELLSQVRFGPIESVKILPEKNCAFISFLDPNTAAAFHSDALMRKVSLHSQELKVGWGKPSAVPASVLMAVQQQGATRNVYLGHLDESITEQSLRDDLARFGPIDQVKIVRDKNIGFVHFLSIQTAIKVVQTLASEPAWVNRRVNYGKDRCAYVPKSQHQQQQHNLAAAQMAASAASFAGGFGLSGFAGGMGMMPGMLDPSQIQPGNRTVYLVRPWPLDSRRFYSDNSRP
jgi:RNA recognition motif-containing protein